jgi:aminoglycoside phosphotransferase family enzyme/predicted kinase
MEATPAHTAALVHELAHRLHAQVVETHISWVLLLPELAYKVKKPVRLPFLDYSTLQQRRHFCEEEVRLNRPFAPSLYLGVSRLTGTASDPDFDGLGDTLDYAVRMRRFPDAALFSERADAGTLAAGDIDRLAARLAEFHAAAAVASEPATATLGERSLAVLATCTPLGPADEWDTLAAWIRAEASAVEPLWQARRAAGHARECHGDLHLGNLLELDGEIAAFDCVEFDPALRRVDVFEDAAFTAMDLVAHGRPALAWRFLNGWLERTGEYEGVTGLRLCLVYRALVRAAAHQLRAPGNAMARHYARQAQAFSRGAAAHLFITNGLPGSGKTHVSQQLLQEIGALRIRSDVERKRLHGLPALADSRTSGIAIYTPDATRRTYGRLFALAEPALRAGWPVVLDAAFLRRAERDQAQALAHALQVPFSILECVAPEDVMRQRLQLRRGDASEANAAVLEQLTAAAEPLAEEERLLVLNAR